MSFLNVALLGGSLALAIPIIIHLFHRSRYRVVPWAAMHLLTSVVKRNSRRLRVEQLLLLLLRAALPVVLALLMARPVWKGAQALLGDAKTSTVILLDNSYSMQAARAGLSHWHSAREEAASIIGSLKRGSEVQVVLMGEGGAALFDTPTYDLARAAQAVKAVEATAGPVALPAALDFAAGVLARMHESSRSLVVLTDFQRISFAAGEDGLVGQMLDRLRAAPAPPQITFFDIGQEMADNVAVESLDFSRLMVGVGQRVSLRANVRNFGEGDYPALRVYFRADGKEKAATQVKLGPRQNAQVLFSHTFETAGSHVLEISADADALKSDNTYLASVPVRDRLPVLLVNGDPGEGPLKGETDFAEIALQPYGAARVELADLITTATCRVPELNEKRLAGISVVVLANVAKLSDSQQRALEDFTRNGGGVLIAPGNKVDAKWYNGPLWREGEGLLPLALGPLNGVAAARPDAPAVAVTAERFDNPALEFFNDSKNGSLSDAAIRTWVRLEESSRAGAGATVLARLENGEPFLAERAFGEGRVIQMATALDADWSNLPMRSFYLPLMQRLAVYLASSVYPPRNLELGRPVTAFLPVAEAGKKASLVLPGGGTVEIPIEAKGPRGVAEYAATREPGLYILTPPGGSPLHYVVNAARRESDLHKLSPAEIAGFAKAHQVAVVRSGEELRAAEHRQRYGQEVWKPLLWALLAFCFLELFLQQRIGGVRGPRAAAPAFGGAKPATKTA